MIPVFKEAVATHLILMSAGIPAEDIYVSLGVTSPQGAMDQLAVFVKQGDFLYTVTVGECKMPWEEFRVEWPKAVGQIHKFTDAQARELRDSTKIRYHAVEIVAGLRAKRAVFERKQSLN